MKTARELILPGPGAPHWRPSAQPPGGLLYLGWGRREYGRYPIPRRRHEGWTYMVVLAGQAVLLTAGRDRRVRPGDVVMAGPEAPYGWSDQAGRKCQLLVWIWSAPPEADAALPETTWVLGRAGGEELEDLAELHRRTRREIQQSDSRSPRVLEGVRVLLDAVFGRSAGRETDHAPRDLHRLQLAEQWMRRHLSSRAPVLALADYLGISAMGLQRLFRRHTRLSPGQTFQQLKMREAVNLLARPGATVKGVAYELGYRHAGDFSRAFARWHGRPATRARRKPATRSSGRGTG
jgi:AraC-like DNA-binding protein